MTDRDDELRVLLHELRALDEAAAPPFRLPAAPVVAARWTPRRWLALAAAAGVVAAVARVVWRHAPEAAQPEPTLDAWRAPTDVLLDQASIDLFRAVPAIGASTIDRFIPETSVFKGD
jgi:hypothetical protein